MSDTPETDKIIQRNTWQDGSITELSAVHKDFARKLERERNELRSTLEYIATADLSARHCEDEARKALAKLTKN